MGGRIVAEVFVGLLQRDPDGSIGDGLGFAPVLGATPGQFGMADLLAVAGVGGRS